MRTILASTDAGFYWQNCQSRSGVQGKRLVDNCIHNNNLTARERQVLALVASGKTGPQIAATLGITVRTARAHREKLAIKLGSSSAAHLTRYAIENGIDVASTKADR
jgi:DNA-binding CsgD family transcriptional regulator